MCLLITGLSFALTCAVLFMFIVPAESYSIISPQWNNTRIMFYGDQSVTVGHLMPEGFVSKFEKSLRAYINTTFGFDWNNITVVQKDDMSSAFNEFQKSVTETNCTLVILQFGLTNVVQGIYTKNNLGPFRFYLDGILRTATELNLTTVVLSPTLYGDNIVDETEEFHTIESMVGIAGSIAGQYQYPFVDVFTAIYTFLAQYNKYGFYQHVVTSNGYTLNDNGNKIVAARLLDLFGIKLEHSSFAELAASTPLITNTFTLADTPFFKYFKQLALNATNTNDATTFTTNIFEYNKFSRFHKRLENRDNQARVKDLLDEDSMLAVGSEEDISASAVTSGVHVKL